MGNIVAGAGTVGGVGGTSAAGNVGGRVEVSGVVVGGVWVEASMERS